MKNHILILVISVFISFAAIAQDNNFRLGIKGGLNLSNLNSEDTDDENMRAGFHAGIFSKIPLTENISFQPELTYSIKGAKLEYNNTVFSGKADFRLDYVDITALAVFNITPNLNIHAGPYVGLLSLAKIKNDTDNSSAFDFEEELDTDDFNKTDFGLAAGIGVDLDRVSAGIRYDLGLMTVGKEREFFGTDYTFPDAKNRVIQVYLGISLF